MPAQACRAGAAIGRAPELPPQKSIAGETPRLPPPEQEKTSRESLAICSQTPTDCRERTSA